jgi:endoglucanase
MKNTASTILLSVLFCAGTVHAASLMDVRPVNDRLLMLHFRAGSISYHTSYADPFADTYTGDSLDIAVASTLTTYTLTSPDDAAYSTPLSPLQIGRKTKTQGIADVWPIYDRLLEHWIYLRLPEPMQQGRTYTVQCPALTATGALQTFEFRYKQQRTEAIHVNQVGYVSDAQQKFAYLYHNAGDMGGIDFSAWEGQPFQVIDDASGTIVYTGTITYRADGEGESFQGEPNYYGSEVWQCDFSAFNGSGDFRIAIPGVGSSFNFSMGEDVYREAFYTNIRGLYHQRSGPAQGMPHSIHEKPVDHMPGVNGFKVYYSNFRVMNEMNQDSAFVLLPAMATTTLMPNAWGGWNDASDYDKYVQHLISSDYLCLVYELAQDHFTDGELNIPESGNGIPDILDEAAWGVDFYLRLKGPTGGISHRLETYSHPGAGVAWTDTMTFYQSKEEPLASFWTAASAAQLAWCLQLAGYPDQAATYQAEAEAIYAWAQNNLLPGDLDLANCRGRRAQAAAWLYKLTGQAAYQEQFITDNAVNEPSATFTPGEENFEMAIWGYVTTHRPGQNSALKAMLIEACEAWAVQQNLSGHNAQACRMGFSQWLPNITGLGSTTPTVMPSIVAHALTGDAQYLSVVQNAADYYLGGNPLNMCWVTGLGDRFPESMAHTRTWYSTLGPIPGLVPYGMTGPQMMGASGWWGGWASGYQASNSYPGFGGLASHELWFNNRYCWITNEFTVHQNVGPSAAVYAYLTGVQDISTRVGGPDDSTTSTPLVHPNPSSDGFQLKLPHRQAIITAFDAQGREVFSGAYTDAFGRDWGPGLYTLRIEIEGDLVTERVVKQ